MHYDALVTFITVVEEKNFTRAAEKLLLSQPSVSIHIKNLESEFQTQLLIRSPKTLRVTHAGEILYERAKQMVQIYENTKNELYELQHTVKGTLKIAASFTIGEYILPTFLSNILSNYPNLDFEVTIGNTKEVVNLVQFFKADIGLIEGNTDAKDIMIKPFMDDELTIVAAPSHPLKEFNTITTADLQNEIWITREKGSGTREFVEHVIRTNGLKMKSMITISSNQGIKETVMNGLGISILSTSVVNRELKDGSLIEVKPKGELFRRKFSYIVTPFAEEKKLTSIFLHSIRSYSNKA